MVDPAIFGMGGQDEHEWTQEELREWILSEKRASFAKYVEWARSKHKVVALQEGLRKTIDAAWEAPERDEARLAELQRKEEAVSNILFGMTMAKIIIYGQRSAEFVHREIWEYVGEGSVESGQDVLEDRLKGFVVRERTAPAPEGADDGAEDGS